MTQLPPNYAEQVLQAEVDLEETPDITRVHALNDLYGIGIDYFLDNEPIKARHLQKKMTALLSRPSIIIILQRDAFGSGDAPKSREQAMRSLNKKMKTEVVKFHTEADDQIRHILEGSKQRVQRALRLKDEALNRQEDQLARRLLSRVKSEDKLRAIKSCKFIRPPPAQ